MENISMRRREQIQQLLPGLVPEADAAKVSYLSSGDMHQVYNLAATKPGSEPKVLKFRKLFPYGKKDSATAAEIAGEYMAVKHFYNRLRQTRVAVPGFYHTGVLDGQHWVCESQMSAALAFEEFTLEQAYQAGSELGQAFYKIYRQTPPCSGQGEILLDEQGELTTRSGQSQQQALTFELARFKKLLGGLVPENEAALLTDKLELAYDIIRRHNWPLTLVNEDLHPENIVRLAGGDFAVIDPKPSVASGARFLAHFTVNCEVFWPLLFSGSLDKAQALWVENLAPLASGFRESVLASGLPEDLYRAEQLLRLCYLVWRHQQHIDGVSGQGSDAVLGTVAQAQQRLALLLQQLVDFTLDTQVQA
ncbi:hypothetical protein SG34_029120 [Thalassomonas viridans]|uniref:Uncharacterized protein n=1 Tax=Thalassomonas viridans TaxID=137584 RepID=A0AAE9Z2X9_9GAMM|nr:hypothetical protein [Thalassomonas viridans]WDE05302.1 hypothetical protein SG34_029120 [Thalassomonas viridans]